jgi:hypothetical protein
MINNRALRTAQRMNEPVVRWQAGQNQLPQPSSPLHLALRVSLLFCVIYLSTWAGHYTTGDGSFKVAWAKAMFLGGPAPGSGTNAAVSKYGIGHSLLAVPPLAIAYLLNKETGIHCEAALYTLMFVVNGALFLALLAFYLAHFYSPRRVWLTVLVAGLATAWWPYSKLDFSEPLVLTIAFLGFVLMRFGHPFWGMSIAAFTLTIRGDSVAIVCPLVIWYLFSNRSMRACIQMAVAIAPSLVLVALADYVRYHSLFDHGYAGERFSTPLLVGLYGILLSSGKSIFLFSPPLLLGVLGWRAFASRAQLRSDAWLFLAIGVVQVLLFAKWWDWSSDDAWGVRFVIPGVLLLCIPMVAILDRRALVIPVVAVGVAVQLLGVLVGPLDFVLLLREQQFQREALYVGGHDRIDFEDLHFNPNYNQVLGNWILVRCLLHLPPPGNPKDASLVGTELYDAIPPQAWVNAARWDFVWNLRRSQRRTVAVRRKPVKASVNAQMRFSN